LIIICSEECVKVRGEVYIILSIESYRYFLKLQSLYRTVAILQIKK